MASFGNRNTTYSCIKPMEPRSTRHASSSRPAYLRGGTLPSAVRMILLRATVQHLSLVTANESAMR